MAKSATYYNVDDFNNYKRTQGKCVPPRTNVLAAASHIQTLFDAKKFTYGFMGGLPMLCLGYKREMPDLHIAYNDKDFERLQVKLESDRRIRLPAGMNPLLPFKILVWTGPSHKDHGCTVDATVELDLVPSGACGSPAAGALAQNLVLLGLQAAPGKQMVFKSLNIQYLMTTLLSYCKARDLLWDPKKDILYLCKHETEGLHRVRGQLNNKEVKELFLGTSFFSRLDMDSQRLCYQTLLDTHPPPTMSITPPASRVQMQPQSRLYESNQNVHERSPRSRYRKATGERGGSNSAAEYLAETHARIQSADHPQDSRRLSHIEGVQYVKSAKPQTVSVTAASKNARSSMPNLTTGHHPSQPLYTNAQDTSRARLQERVYGMPRPGQVHDCSTSSGLQSVHASSRLEYGADFRPTYMNAKHDTDSGDQPLRAGYKKLPNNTDLTDSAVHAMRSQRGSLHTASPEREQLPSQQLSEDARALQHGKLHLVGPEGVYGAPQKPPETGQEQAKHLRNHSAPPPRIQPNFIFELDAGPPLGSKFVAELPADSIMPSSAGQHQDSSRPSAVRTSSAPLGNVSLPASLVAGRPGMHAHHQSFDHSDPPAEREARFSPHQTNAYRYSSYACPSSTIAPASQEGATGPTYKAYRPFVLTNQLSRNDSVSSVYSPGHRRDASDDSTVSHDSTKLAREYQELLDFDLGYGSN
ncbi:hypothetical protein SVAN01_04166 [Stagonosporopsis vannaccii]|nr:hypothetical protein SVAN01_04166 [Stagonosporopsis vannaccii]